jgi:hypothetical protein
MVKGMLVLTMIASAGALSAEIVPGSMCTYNSGTTPPGLVCTLYPSTNTTGGTGTFDADVNIPIASLISGTGDAVTDGYLVLLTPTAVIMAGQDNNPNDYLQVLEFAPLTGVGGVTDGLEVATSLNLYTAGCGGSAASCFPTVTTLDASDTLFVNDNVSNTFVYDPISSPLYNNVYTVNYVANTAPEPATFVVGFGGLAVVAMMRRWRRGNR